MFRAAHTPDNWPAGLSLTETGRRIRVHSLALPFVRALLAHPAVSAAAQRWKLCLVALAALALYGRKKRAASAASKPPAADVKKSDTGGDALPTWTQLLTGDDGRIPGLRAAVAVVAALGFANAVTRNAKLVAMSNLQASQNTGDMATYARYMRRYIATCFVGSTCLCGIDYFKSGLALRWRQLLTRKLHDLYFQNRLYYKLLNEQGESNIADPDIRIVAQVEQVCDGYAGISLSMIQMLLSLVVIWYDLARRRNAWVCLVAPTYAMTIFPPLIMLGVLDPKTILEPFHQAQAAFSQVLTRVQLHGERICMLRGEHFEYDAVTRRLQEACYRSRVMLEARLPFLCAASAVGSEAYPSSALTFGHFVGTSIVALALRGPGGVAEAGPLDTLQPRPDAPDVFRQTFQEANTGMALMMAFTAPAMSFNTLQQSKGASLQVQRLFATLQRVKEESDKSAQETFISDDSMISFQDVTVATPAGHKLVEHLTFEVPYGERLIICGHNGAGKSSIIRCLSALWTIPHGKITRPGGAAQAEEDERQLDDVYYLPQKPCNVIGNLSDQLTYPAKVPGGLPAAELKRWLAYVDLEYLLEREQQGFGASGERDWEERLSLGEQQALSIVRLLYHRPRFAILDECTSAVSRTIEVRLFTMALELGISCITITHRPMLEEHHGAKLVLTGKLDEDGRGWEFVSLPHRDQLPPVKPHAADAAEAHRRLEAISSRKDGGASPKLSEAQPSPTDSSAVQSVGAQDAAQRAVQKRWPSTMSKLVAVFRLAFSEPGTAARMGRRVALMLVLLRVRCNFNWEVWTTIISMHGHAMVGDLVGICSELLVNISLVGISMVMDVTTIHLARSLGEDLWQSLSMALFRRGLMTGAFHTVMRPPSPEVHYIEDPLQRIAEVKHLSEVIAGMFETLPTHAAMFLYCSGMLFRGGGWVPAAFIAAYALAFRGCLLLAPDYAGRQAKGQELETRYQVLHSRFRKTAEPVAFTGGGSAERGRIEPHFQAACDHKWRSLGVKFVYECVNDLFGNNQYLPLLTQRLVAVDFVRRNTPYYGGPQGVAPDLIMKHFLYDRSFGYAQTTMQHIGKSIPKVKGIIGSMTRVLELAVACDSARGTPAPGAGGAAACGAGPVIAVGDLDLVAPGGRSLARGVSFKVEEGAPLLVTGPNASGKTILGSVLLGLWPASGDGASVTVPGGAMPPPLSVLMPATQRIYLPLGTLGDQVCYPGRHTPGEGAQEATMAEALGYGGISHILTREEEGWLAEHTWEEILSGGEQQRLCLARVFYRRPQFALLDECTSMIAASSEEALYRTAVKDLGITPITLSQRLFLPGLHAQELHLASPDAECGWSLVKLDQN